MKTYPKSIFNVFTFLALLTSLIGSAVFVTPAYAAGIVVNSNADGTLPNLDANSTCDLREAITNANNDAATYADCAVGSGADTITFAADYTITLASQLPAVTSAITITGNGAANTIVQANELPNKANYRVFEVNNTGNLTLDGLTVRHGDCSGECSATGFGGGILNRGILNVANSIISENYEYTGGGISNSGTLNVTNSTFSGNSAHSVGGGISNSGTLNVTNSTFSENSVFGNGGGIFSDGTLNVTNSTFFGNIVGLGDGEGIYNQGEGIATLRNTIIVAIDGRNRECSGTIIADAYNLASGSTCGGATQKTPAEINLGTLTGSPAYYPLSSGSAAIDAGNDTVCAAAVGSPNYGAGGFDQRGVVRPQGTHCDVGSYEKLPAPTVISILRADPDNTNATSVNFTVTFYEPVTGVDVADFKLTNTILTGASITGVTPVSTSIYTVTVNTGTGNGTIRLDVPATASIQDSGGNYLVDPYTGGEYYTVNKGTAPTVPVLVSPIDNALVTTTPTLDWDDSSVVMALAVPGWHYEINVTANYGLYDEMFNTVDDADPSIGLAESQYILLTPLAANTIFTWKVRAYNDANQYSVWSLARTFRTKLAPPSLTSPANSAAPALPNKRPTFTWDAVDGAVSYTIQILKVGKPVSTVTTNVLTYTPKVDLLPNTTYTWMVKANGINQGDYSAPFTFTTSLNAPQVPVPIAPLAAALVDSAVPQTLSWNPVLAINTTHPSTTYPAAVSYDVEYATNSAFVSSTLVSVAAPDTQHPMASPLPANTTFYWRVRSYNLTGQYSAWSATRIFKTRLATPTLNSPADLTILNNIRPTFEWDEVPGAITYTLQILKAGKVVNTGTIKVPAYTYTPTVDLLPSTTYRWRVKANGVNAGVYSAPFTFITSAHPPTTPVLSTPANAALLAANGSQTLAWNPSTNAPLSYEVEYANNSTFTGNTFVTNTVAAPATQLIIATLPGRTYYWRVRAWSTADTSGIHSAWSAVWTIKVKFVAPLLDSVVVTDGSPAFVWHSANGLWTSYTLLVINSTTNKVVKSFTVPAPITTYTIPAALLPTGTYRWQVKINGLYMPISSAISAVTFTK